MKQDENIEKRDIHNFISIQEQRNGNFKIDINDFNRINIYKLLYENGYRKSQINKKRIYYKREKNKLNKIHKHDIVNVFYFMLKNLEFVNIPSKIEYSDIINLYLEKDPIKENKLFNFYLRETLTETETHELRMQFDVDYKHEFEIKQILLKFEEWSFCKTIDTIGTFCKNNPLYFKNIGNNGYLIFNHFNLKKKAKNDGFDCWHATYYNQESIGKKQPLNIKSIRLGFNLERDISLIKNEINLF